MKKKITSLLLIVSLGFVVAQKPIPLTLRLNEVYKNTPINVAASIKTFSSFLLKKGVLNSSDLSNPDLIYDKLSALTQVNPAEYGIERYVDGSIIKDWKSKQNILDASIDDQVNIALFTYYQIFSEEYAKIKLQVKANRTVDFAGEHLPMVSFDRVILNQINQLNEKGVLTNQAIVVLEAEPATQFEFLTFIQSKLRTLEVKRIEYTKKK